MKNKLLLITALVFCGLTYGQYSQDFESSTLTPIVRGGGLPQATGANAANPVTNGINSSATAFQITLTNTAPAWRHLAINNPGGSYGAANGVFYKFKFLTVNETNVDITLDPWFSSVNYRTVTKSFTGLALNTWYEVEFDFTTAFLASDGVTPAGANPGYLSRIDFKINNVGTYDGDVFYIDDIVQESSAGIDHVSTQDGALSAASSWGGVSTPGSGDYVDIGHDITNSGNVSINKLLIRSNKSLDVDGDITVAETSNLWAGSSLIASGTATGTFNYYRVITEPAAGDLEGWHLVSSPVSGEEYNDAWIAAYTIASGPGNAGANRGIATYNNIGDAGTWTYALAPVGDTPFDEGKGYSMKSTGGGTVQFTGNLRTANITDIALTKTGTNGFNLVGNPFAGYVSATDLFTANNSGGNDLLTESTIWVWNTVTKAYNAQVGGFQIAPGQGFFVEATAAATTFTINTSMLSAQSTDTFLKSAKTEIQLNITDGDLSRYAKINYLGNATKDFDNGYDAKLFGGISQPFAVYTHLVSNNEGKNYQIQALPNSDLEAMVIPVGINGEANKEITFSADALNLPSGLKVFLEDRFTNTFTRLDEANSNYKVTLEDALNGTGRFYLHTKSSALSTADVLLESISIYKTDNSNLRVAGLQKGNASVKLYNILGKQMITTSFKADGVNNISLPNLAKGVYIVQLSTESGKLNKKIIIE